MGIKTDCSYCGKSFILRDSVFCEECSKPDARPDKLTLEQNVQVLKNLREYVLRTSLDYNNSDVIGDRHSECNWGMCNDTKEVWNKPEYHKWAHSFKTENRIAPIDRVIKCHFDTRSSREEINDDYYGYYYGCFYECRVFQWHKFKTLPTRKETVRMIDELIEKYENKQEQE